MIRAVVPRFREAGLPARILFCESVNARTAWRYIEQLQSQPDLWDPVGCLSYHWYCNDNLTWMPKIQAFAAERGLPTAQTEFMQLTIDHLWWDLTVGGTSYWEVYGLCSPDYEAALSHVSSTTFRGGDWYWRFRQVSHYVRPGAVRIAASSDSEAIRALAFDRDGLPTVVLLAGDGGDRAVTIAHLVPGTYGVSVATGRQVSRELGPQEVRRNGSLKLTIPANSVMTLYPRGRENLPPTVTAWRSEPDWLALPRTTLTLHAEATDPDAEPLTPSGGSWPNRRRRRAAWPAGPAALSRLGA